MGPSVNYQAPPPDTTFREYLKYVQEKDAAAEERAAEQRKADELAKQARKAAGAASYSGLKKSVFQQLNQGIIDFSTAQNTLRDYAAKYELSPPEADINLLTQQHITALPQKRATGITAAYEELMGRPATAQELSKAQERFKQGYYGSIEDFKTSLTKSPEYTKKFNQSYLDNYYDTQFGKQVVDAKGEKTGKRAFTFDASLLPTYAGDLSGKTDVKLPSFGKQIIGTPEELEMQQQNIRDTRQYLYSAGLTNLQGEIDKETQKLKNEGAKEVAQIQSKSAMYSNLLSGFWS